MIKIAQRCNDKILILDGAVPKMLSQWTRKNRTQDVIDKQYNPDWLVKIGEGGSPFSMAPEYMFNHSSNGRFSLPPGAFLNERGMALLGKRLYTTHSHSQYISSPPFNDEILAGNYKMIEWDGADEAISDDAWPSGTGGRIVWGYSYRDQAWLTYPFGFIVAGMDIGLIEHNGNIFGIGCVKRHSFSYEGFIDSVQEDPVLTNGEAMKIVGRETWNPGVSNSQIPFYYTFLYNPRANNGSGLTTFNIYQSGTYPTTNGRHGEFNMPTWTDYWTTGQGILTDAPWYNANILDIEEHQGKIYATSAFHLIQCGSGHGDMKILDSTIDTAYDPTPKWLCKYNGKLYMHNAKGVVSEIIPNATKTDVTISGVTDLSYIAPLTMRYGGLHAREWGIDRSTKNAFFEHNGELHVMFGASSGTYHFASSGSLETWENRTDDLPTLMKQRPGNVYTISDPQDNTLRVVYQTMSDQGAIGFTTFGDKSAGIGHQYRYDTHARTWTKFGWFPYPSYHAGSELVGFDYEGPYVGLPSGVNYPVSGIPTTDDTDITPAVYKCRDYAVVDFQLFDHLSRDLDVRIQFSLDDGSNWQDCYRFKNYETLQYMGDPITNLSASPSGEWHTFYWDFVKSIGYNVEYPYTKLRIIPSVSNI